MTLVELLIVIAIIAVIAGLSMSVLVRVRQRAYLATCISNLRQLVQAVHMYEDDWGTVPVEEHVKLPDGWWGWFQQRVFSYVHNDSVFLCPSDYTEGEGVFSEDRIGYKFVPVWKGRSWKTSYWYMVNVVTVQEYSKGSLRLKNDSPIICCDWHIPYNRSFLIARYDGRIEIAPIGLYRELRAQFEYE